MYPISSCHFWFFWSSFFSKWISISHIEIICQNGKVYNVLISSYLCSFWLDGIFLGFIVIQPTQAMYNEKSWPPWQLNRYLAHLQFAYSLASTQSLSLLKTLRKVPVNPWRKRHPWIRSQKTSIFLSSKWNPTKLFLPNRWNYKGKAVKTKGLGSLLCNYQSPLSTNNKSYLKGKGRMPLPTRPLN